MSVKKYYFAYGSNINLNDLSKWCKKKGHKPVTPVFSKPAKLYGYRLIFNYFSSCRNSSALNIGKNGNDEYICGVLFRLSEEDYQKIRKKEGACGENPYYVEIPVGVEVDGKLIKAKTFKAVKKREIEFQKPSREYLDIVRKGAEEFKLGKECIEKIEQAAKGN